MKKVAILVLSSFFLILISCEKIIYFDVETQEGKLVVNSFIGPESGAIADVSESLDPLNENYPEYITDATIELYKNDVFIDAFVYDGSLLKYTADETVTSANAGDVFKIIASAPGNEPVSAATTIPEKIEIEDVRIVDTVLLQAYELGYPDSIPYYKVEIDFTDPAGDNYYSLQVKYEDAISSSSVCFSTDDPVYTIGDEFNFGNGDENTLYTICENSYFSDITFDGTKKTFTIYVIVIDGIFFPDAKYIFSLQHLSQEYYKYFSSSNLQQGSEGDPFAQPVTVFSNIDGGFGIFASYNGSKAEVEL